MACIRLALPAVLSLFILNPSIAAAPEGPTATPNSPKEVQAFGASACAKTYTRPMFHDAARAAVRRRPLTRDELSTIRRIVRCARSPRSRASMRWHWRRYKHRYRVRMAVIRARAAIARYTPYRCGGSRWAIPCSIIACESGFSWTAYNPSGAMGPYQLLGKGAPWPVRSMADKLAHHRIAFNLYAGGRGRSHWVC